MSNSMFTYDALTVCLLGRFIPDVLETYFFTEALAVIVVSGLC